ncbi:hypothetical protein ACPCHT_21010 [Nucisporomicrobium flavum]|uniref:hypothetical protein n=1 Tax=Nucisporomicrobium flavum TaxID=2785915 RepID=UPI0018F54977|nr:hypothetical protein [Nucisporomicrobium flavum]
MPYGWMLVTYPRDYRREHGAELLEPLLAEGRRPAVREVVNLLGHGLRTRIGRPGSRAAVVCAVLTTVIAGVFGAAFGSWAGWRTSGPLPEPGWARALLADVAPGSDVETVEPPSSSSSSRFALLSRGLSWDDVDGVLFASVTEHRAATAGARVGLPSGTDPETPAREVTARLVLTGWTVHAPIRTDVPGDPAAGARSIRIEAVRDGWTLTLEARPAHADRAAVLTAIVRRPTPAAAWIGGVAGALAAGAIAFLLFAWASRRTGRPGHPARVAVIVPFGLAMMFWWVPTTAAVALVGSSLRSEPQVRGTQLWEWLGQPTMSALFLAGAALAALSLLLAALPPGRELPRTGPVTDW